MGLSLFVEIILFPEFPYEPLAAQFPRNLQKNPKCSCRRDNTMAISPQNSTDRYHTFGTVVLLYLRHPLCAKLQGAGRNTVYLEGSCVDYIAQIYLKEPNPQTFLTLFMGDTYSMGWHGTDFGDFSPMGTVRMVWRNGANTND